MNNIQNYKRAIKILEEASLEQMRIILFRVAYITPGAIVRAVDGPPKKAASAKTKKECKELYQSGKRIEAVKIWRAETGVGLTEAKDAIEGL